MLHKNLPVLIIPAFNPDKTLVNLLSEHHALNCGQHCIVVNDGSKPDLLPIFNELEDMGYTVLHHAHNQGKGTALKTAMNYYLAHLSESSPGVITADADGQHSLKDIIHLSKLFPEEPNKLHLGVRHISQAGIPLRSRLGNVFTKFVFNLLTNNKVQDTQTGLRAIPVDLIKYLVMSKTSRYEFEFEMFFIAKKHHFEIKQIPIETIYIDHNKGSHFNPLFDSLRIYFIFIRFCFVSISSFLLDFSLFALLYHYTNDSVLSVLGARLFSVPFNFLLNKNISFKYKQNIFRAATLYLALSLIIAFSSLQMMNLIHYLGLNIYVSKILAEFLIFIANFFTQYLLVFSRRSKLLEAN